MKRYLLFGGPCYYPSGGWGDFMGSFDTVAECITKAKTPDGVYHSTPEWWHVIDSETGKEVAAD